MHCSGRRRGCLLPRNGPIARDGPITVGIGASAGGVEALQSFFRAMPADAGLAFIVVIHIGRGHGSALPDILGRCTSMPVLVARTLRKERTALVRQDISA